MRPKSEIYTPKRDDEHPHPFHMPSPPPGYSLFCAVIHHHHTHFLLTIITHVGESDGVNMGPKKHCLPFLNNTSSPWSLRKSFLMTEHWVQIYSNQKEIKYIWHSKIRASVETRPPKLHNLLQFSPPFHPWHFMALPPPSSFASFCDTRISSKEL